MNLKNSPQSPQIKKANQEGDKSKAGRTKTNRTKTETKQLRTRTKHEKKDKEKFRKPPKKVHQLEPASELALLALTKEPGLLEEH